MGITSNKDDVLAGLSGLASALDLTRPGTGGQSLGSKLIETGARAIQARTRSGQTDPAGGPLAALTERYRRRKLRLGLDGRILVATGEMTSLDQIEGAKVVAPDSAESTAGLDDHDRDLIQWAEDGGPNRPERHWIDLGPDGEAAVDQVVQQTIDRAIDAGGP